MIEEAAQAGQDFDEPFCRHAEARLWESERATTCWNNALLQPPPPHLIEALGAAAGDQSVANALINTMLNPERALQTFASPDTAAAFVARHRQPQRASA